MTSEDREPRQVREIDLRESLDASEILIGNRPALVRGSIWLLSGLVLAAILFAAFTSVDNVVIARGRVTVEGDQYDVQCVMTGTVREVRVRPGDRVDLDQPLVVLDTRDHELGRALTAGQLRRRQTERELVAAQIERLRSKVDAETRSLAREIELARTLEELTRAEIERKRVELDFRRKKEEETGRFFADKLARLAKLDDAASELEVEAARTQELLARYGLEEASEGLALAEESAPIEARYANLQVLRAESDRLLRTYASALTLGDLEIRMAGVEAEIERLRQELEKLDEKIADCTIRAPAAGVVTLARVLRAGEVLQIGDDVVRISPGTRYVLEARVRNEDMGELRRGLDAKIKFHAFPYQDYGTFSGKVLDISPDTVDAEGSLFEIAVSCPIEEIRERTGKEEILGFAADLDIVTGREPLLARLLGRRRAGAAD